MDYSPIWCEVNRCHSEIRAAATRQVRRWGDGTIVVACTPCWEAVVKEELKRANSKPRRLPKETFIVEDLQITDENAQ